MNFKLKNLLSYKMIGTKTKNVFGLHKDELVMVSKDDIDFYKSSNSYDYHEEQLKLLYEAGKLEIFNRPKKGDLCYFFNVQDKMKQTKDGPFIAKYNGVIMDGRTQRFLAKDCDITFLYCEPLLTKKDLK